MSYDRNIVINIAKAEVGYLEKSASAYKANPDILDDKTAGAGKDNYTKYGRDMNQIYPQTMNFADYWCDTFVDWCFQKAYGVSNAKGLLGGGFDDYTISSAKLYKDHNALDKTPEVGAQVFFTKNGDISGCYHTGLVIAVSTDGKSFTTIEGNTSSTGTKIVDNGGCVAQKSRKASGNTLFGHPAYNDGYSTPKTSTVTTDKNGVSFEKGYANGKQFKVTASALNMRTNASTSISSKIVEIIPRNTAVMWYGYFKMNGADKWLYVKNPRTGKVGYCHSKYLA